MKKLIIEIPFVNENFTALLARNMEKDNHIVELKLSLAIEQITQHNGKLFNPFDKKTILTGTVMKAELLNMKDIKIKN